MLATDVCTSSPSATRGRRRSRPSTIISWVSRTARTLSTSCGCCRGPPCVWGVHGGEQSACGGGCHPGDASGRHGALVTTPRAPGSRDPRCSASARARFPAARTRSRVAPRVRRVRRRSRLGGASLPHRG
jgi:hypothetical protein